MSKGWKTIEMSDYARLSVNPLRKLNFDRSVTSNPEKDVITLQLGDPSVFGNFPPASEVLEAIKEAVDLDSFCYNEGPGRLEAREAIAEYYGGIVSPDDIVLSSGCGHALEMCILTLVAPGENLLIPRPCYSYRPLTDGTKVVSKSYNLNPEKGWDIDLKHMENLIDDKTRAILINNPGNPCGNAFSKEHIEDILDIAERHHLPIIADEIYGFMVFPGVKFHSFASVTKNVPVLVCGGLTKRFLMPGIRMGWVMIHDRHRALPEVKIGIRNITGRILGPNSTIQYALPAILRNTPKTFFTDTMDTIAVSSENISHENDSRIDFNFISASRGNLL